MSTLPISIGYSFAKDSRGILFNLSNYYRWKKENRQIPRPQHLRYQLCHQSSQSSFPRMEVIFSRFILFRIGKSSQKDAQTDVSSATIDQSAYGRSGVKSFNGGGGSHQKVINQLRYAQKLISVIDNLSMLLTASFKVPVRKISEIKKQAPSSLGKSMGSRSHILYLQSCRRCQETMEYKQVKLYRMQGEWVLDSIMWLKNSELMLLNIRCMEEGILRRSILYLDLDSMILRLH